MLPFKRLFVAARGGTAIRLAKAARRAGLSPVAAFVPVDRDASWTGYFDRLAPVDSYTSAPDLLAAACALEADAVHPGVGFLAESAEFARLSRAAGLTWVGPSAQALEALSDKCQLVRLAQELGVPVPETSEVLTDAAQIVAFAQEHGWPLILKTVHGGGGSGVTVLSDAAQAELAWNAGTTSTPRLVQRAVSRARHIEVQALGDGSGQIHTLGTRECTVQRRSQKIFEEAPAVGLQAQTVELLESATRAVLGAVRYCGVATCEFLLPTDLPEAAPLLLEVNARLQVEHAVTEAISGVDLVAAQLALAAAAPLEQVLAGQALVPTLTGETPASHAAEVRLYAELAADDFAPSSGVLTAFSLPLSMTGTSSGETVARARVERSVVTGDLVRPEFSDPLALVSVAADSRAGALAGLREILQETVVYGVDTLRELLLLLLEDPALTQLPLAATTRWLEEEALPRYLQTGLLAPPPVREVMPAVDGADAAATHLRSQLAGTVVSLPVSPGQQVSAGDLVAVLEAMKMRLPLTAAQAGVVESVHVRAGATVEEGELLLTLRPQGAPPVSPVETAKPDATPSARPTARERVTALADAGTLRDLQDEDAVLTCRAQITGREVLIWAQDPTVRGGTMGLAGARRVAELIDEAARTHTPIFGLLDGGGARIQEGVDALAGVGLILRACARARGQVLHTALVLGAAAGGAAYAPALADVVVMVRGQSALFLTGPSVVRTSTGEQISAQDLGGASVHANGSGSCHVTVTSEAAAWRMARRLLAFAPRYFDQQARLVVLPGGAGKQVLSTDLPTDSLVPADPAHAYDVRTLLARLTDRGELLELRPDWAPNVVTGFAHLNGLPVGVVANQPQAAAGALDTLASQKIAEHVRLCSDLHLPLLTVVDTPGFLPGSAQESSGAIRHGARVVEAYAASRSRLVTLVTRKAYGGAFVALGSQTLSGATVLAWPQARLGVMNAASAVSVTHRRELQTAGSAQEELFAALVSAQEEQESAARAEESGWVDAVVAPAHTRARLAAELGQGAALSTNMRLRHPGDGWVHCGCGNRHWGVNGAAGVLVWRVWAGQLQVLLQLRAGWTHSGGTWGLPGGAIASGEDALQGALRECEEETGLPGHLLVPGGQHVQQHPDWAYTTVVARAPSDPAWDYLPPVDGESDALEWVSVDADRRPPSDRKLLPALEAAWEGLLALVPQRFDDGDAD